MVHCSKCLSEFTELPAEGVCPSCGEEIVAPNEIGSAGKETADDVSIELVTDDSSETFFDIEAADEGATIELPVNPTVSDADQFKVEDQNQTVEFSQEKTIEFDSLDNVESNDIDATIDLPAQRLTDPNTSDRTIDFGADESHDVNFSWGDEASKTIRQDQTIEIGKTVSGFRSTLPIKSRSLKRSEPKGLADDIGTKTTLGDAPDYELLSMLGQGGMGVVYSAKQSSIARTVAVKMLKTGEGKSTDSGTQGSLDQRDKFISEAVITGELEHPNIVPIYDLGANDEGALFYSMKRVKGTPWDEVINEKTLGDNLSILMRVADAMAFAHANGVVHRDLKPENVMLGDFGEVLVMDWGLARVTSDFPSATSVYQAESLGGTPAYMSPEMAQGPIEKIDHRSDVYLLGAILFEVISGKPPHVGKNVMDCLMAASKNIIVPTDYEGELLGIAKRALETKPESRFQSVKEFQHAVNVYLAHAESITLAANADRHLEEAREKNDYELYSRALYGYEEAIALWDGNEHARKELTHSRIEYSKSALVKGDFDLAATLLESHDPGLDAESLAKHKVEEEVVGLREQIALAQKERVAKLRRLRDLKRLAVGLVALLFAIGTYSYLAVSHQKNEAIAQKEIAEEQRGIAVEKEAEATEQRGIAEGNAIKALAAKKEADTQRDEAEYQKGVAVKNEALAIENEKEALKQKTAAEQARTIAVEAKANEAYEAYVARIGLAAEKIEENAFGEAISLLQACPQELRHWEWGRLRYLCSLSERVDDLGAPVDQVAYSPNGKQYASGDWFGNVTLRDVSSGKVLWKTRLAQYVHAVAFSPDGNRLAAAASDGVVYQLNANTGEKLNQLRGHSDAVLTVAYSPNGRLIASGGYDETARLWDADSGESLQELKGHTWWVWSVTFSPNGKMLVTTGQDGRAVVWEQTENDNEFERRNEFTGHEGPVYDAAFSPNSLQVVSAGFDQTLCVWNPKETNNIDLERRLDGLPDSVSKHLVLPGHTGPVRSIAYAPDGMRLLSGSQDNTLRLWDLEGETSRALRGHGGRVFSVCFSPDGTAALSAGHDHEVRHWSLGKYREEIPLHTQPLKGHRDAILSASFSRDGSQVVTASRDRTARLWDVASGKNKMSYTEGHDFLASSAQLTANGRTLVTSAGDNTVRVWDVATATEKLLLTETGRSAAMVVDPAGNWIATGGPKGAIRWWDAKSGEMLQEKLPSGEDLTAMASSADGTLIASGDQRGDIRLWRKDPADGWIFQTKFDGHSRTITALRFTADSKRLVSASGDSSCGQWDVENRTELRSLVLKHSDWVGSLDISADGRFAVTACDDGKARLWSLSDAKVLAETEMPNTIINSVDMDPSGKEVLLTSSGNRTVSRWDVSNLIDSRSANSSSVISPPVSSPTILIGKEKGAGLIWSASYGTDQKSLITVGGNDAQLWRLDPLRPTVSFSPHGAVADAKLSPNNKLVATGSWDHSAKLWDAATGKAVQKLEGGHNGFINSVNFSSDGQELLTASDDRTVRFWRVATGDLDGLALSGHTGRVMHAVYGSEGKLVLTASADKTARLWDRATGKQLQVFAGHDWAVLGCALSNDGLVAVTGSADNKAKVWNVATGKVICTLSGHTASVSSVAISPDGRRILTGGQDNLAKLWDASTGKEILSLGGHTEEVTSVAFSPDGQSALTASRDSQAIVWPASNWAE